MKVYTVFTLLHTNDFHNALNQVQAEYLRQMRVALGSRGLLVDAGDAVASGNITFRPGGEEILRTMTDVGYDALTVGNREFHFSRYGFHCKIGQARFPVLCANMRPSHTLPNSSAANLPHPSQEPADEVPAAPYMLRELTCEADTLRVLFIGFTVPMITERMLSRKASAYIFDDPIVVASRLAPQLREEHKPDLLVALTHIGIGQDRKLAEAVPTIDLIVGGHTHVVLEQGERIGETLLVQAGSHGRFLGRVDIEAATGPSRRPCLKASLLPLPKQPTQQQTMEAARALQVGGRVSCDRTCSQHGEFAS